MAKIKLRVPPSMPIEGTTWEREDGVVFTYYKGKGWIR